MHYYQFNIGDYKSHTDHLTNLEDLGYRRLLDWLYLHEKPLPLDESKISRLIRMGENQEEISTVLNEFFTKTDLGWVHLRVEEEVLNFKSKQDVARANGKKGGRPKQKENPNETKPVILANQEGSGLQANQKPLNTKQEPLNKEIREKAKRFVPPQLQNVIDYCNERANNVDANKFIDHYTSNGWLVGKNKMKDWKAAVRTWEKTSFKQSGNTSHDDWKQDLLNSDYSHILGE